jgi:ribosomal protein S17E
MQGITAMKVPDKYEPKNTDEFGTFDRAVTRLMSIPVSEVKRRVAKHKKRKKKKSKSSESGPSRDSA